MITSNRLIQRLAKSPLLWGGLASLGFYALIHRGLLGEQFFQRYCAHHTVEYVETVLFFIGLAALLTKLLDIAAQSHRVRLTLLEPVTHGSQTLEDCDVLLDQLDQVPERWQDDYLVRRFRDALEYLRRSGTIQGLDDHLRYLADLDANRQNAGYSFVRLVVWAIPILGFLGTVVGITMAIAHLSPQALEASLPQVITGLGVAFDTTALALALSMGLMFLQYIVDRNETALLNQVDQRVEAELIGRFEEISDGPDGQLLAVRRMMETMLQSTEQLVKHQTQLWWSTVESAKQRWDQLIETTGRQLQTSMTTALEQSLRSHAQELATQEEALADKNCRNWERLQQFLLQNTETFASLQKAVVQKAEQIARAVEATGQIGRLEDSLNRNLAALAGSKNFEQTVMSLAAAIHLLNGRLADLPGEASSVQLEAPRRTTGQAA
ncbi:MAG: MotA/TolQ/ExbB proton channel family protein [Thermoguttaceae bacterium]